VYAALCAGCTPQLPALAIEYTDYAAWQRNYLEAGELERQLEYWQEKLGAEHPPLPLPTDYARPAAQSFRGAEWEFELGACAELRRFAQGRQATLFMLVLAAFKVLLYRYTGQGDVRVGVPIANRQRAEIEALVGFFVNTQVLRTVLHDESERAAPDFEEVLQRVRDTALAAQAHQDAPFEQLVEILNPARSLAHNPLFQVKYNYQRWHHGGAQNVAGLHWEVRANGRHGTHFDLGLDVTETDDTLRGRFVYATDLFAPETIARLAVHLRNLLHALVAQPRSAIDAVDFLDAAEHRQLERWSENTQPLPARTVLDLFREQAAAHPDAIAACDETSALSYRELDRASDGVAHYLHSMGCGAEKRVALCAARSPSAVAALFGILKAGATCVPLDPKWPARRLKDIVDDCAPALLLHDGGLDVQLVDIRAVTLDALAAAEAAHVGRVLPLQSAYIIYTSGSTGRPKGVVVSHAALGNYVGGLLREMRWPRPCAMAMVSTLAADLGHTVLFGALCSGATLHLIDTENAADPDRFAHYMARHRIDVLKIVPGHLAALLQAERAADVLPRHSLIVGGESCPWELAARVQRLRPDCRLVNHYGPTETTVGALINRAAARTDCRTLPLGTPLPNVRIHLLDVRLNPVPVGVAGEIYIGGAGLARGYWTRPAQTAERFVPDPFGAPGARLYRSGDRARYRADGVLEFLGRMDQQVKIRGFRVEPDEAAQVLRALPELSAAAVLARTGEDESTRLVAYYVAREGIAVGDAFLRAQLAARLPDYLIPTAWVALAALPLTANGKLDRAALPAPVQRVDETPRSDEPGNDTERLLADIWCAVLKREHVGVRDNFFELGGDSILSLQIVARARKQGLAIAPKRLFERQTIAELAAALIADGAAAPAPETDTPRHEEFSLNEAQWRALALAREQVRAVYPLTPLQQGMLLHTLLHGGSGTHINQRSCTLRGAFDAPAFRAAWSCALARHPALRTVFVWEGGDEALQVVCANVTLPFIELDWRDCADHTAALRDYLAEDRARGFDPGTAPLMRLAVIRIEQEQWFVVWSLHHLLLDGWSSGQLLNEVFADYAARRAGSALSLPARPSFRDYVMWQRAQDSVRAEHFWREQLADLEQPTLLAQHVPPASAQTGHASLIRLLPADFSAALRGFVGGQRLTLNTAIQGAMALLLALYCRQRDVVLGTTVSGRNAGPAGIQDMVGLLINTLPLRVRIEPERGVGDWLRALQDRHSAARDFEYAPLAAVQRCSAVPRGTPLFDTLLVFQNYPVEPALAAHVEAAGLDDLQSFEQTVYPLTLMVVARGDELRLRFDYDCATFDAAAVEGFCAQLEQLLRGFISHADAPLGELSALTAAEQQRLLSAWNDTTRAWAADADLIDLIEARAAAQPDTLVLRGERDWRYGELNARANRLAHHLRAAGVGPEVMVALCLPRTDALIVALLAVLKAGGAYVPLDPAFSRERLAQMLDDARPQLVLTQQALLDLLPPTARAWCFDRDGAELERHATDNPPRLARPDHPAYCLYTSGSTGRPKGVAVRRGALTNFLLSLAEAPGLDADDRVLALTNITFDIAALEIYLPLLCGAGIVLVPRALATDPGALMDRIAQQGVTVMQATPTAWRLLSEEPRFARLSLRLALCGGEALPADLAIALTRCAQQAWNLYGPTETTIWSSRQRLDAAPPRLGFAIANTTLHVLDAQLRPAPVGVIGELHIGGAGLARGYWRRAGLTALQFVPDPFAAGARLYRTGDLARRLADGAIEYCGRVDHQVKIRGFRIEPGEIEARLLAHPDIAQAAVIARTGPQGDQLIAYVVARDHGAVDADALRADLAAHLPEYMLPAHIIALAVLPLTPSGKLDRRALPDPQWQRREYAAPRTALEQRIAAIWGDMLGLDRVGADDDFFELGGHSLLAARVTARMRRELEVDLSFDRIFTLATPAALAASLEGQSAAANAADIAVMDELLADLE